MADVKSRLDSARATLADVDARLSTAALDSLNDDTGFQAIEAEATKARAAVRQLALALTVAEKRRDDAEHRMRMANSAKQRARALRYLMERDQAGERLQAAVAVVAKEWQAMCAAADRARTALAPLIPESQSRSGFALGAAELESLLGREHWRAGLSVGAEKPLRLGAPGAYTPDNAPSLMAYLSDATELARQILGGERNYSGQRPSKKSEPKKSIVQRIKEASPWRHDNDVALDAARETGAATADMKAARQKHEREQAIRTLGCDPPNRHEGETDAEYLRRVDDAFPAGSLTDEERAALHQTSGPKRSADEIMAEMRSQGGYSTVFDNRGAKPSEDW